MQIIRVQTDYMENPMGFDFDRPALSWVVQSDGVNKRQSAYRLQIAHDPGFDAPIYDTGKRASGQSVGITPDLSLAARTRYVWRVKVWDEMDDWSDWSETASFETGKMGEPWAAKWIGGGDEHPQLRRAFVCQKAVRRARVYACGVGFYRLFLNGQTVGSEELAPGINAYDQWLQYQTYDVTEQLCPGENVLGAWLADGYYKGRVGWPSVEERRDLYGNQLGLILELRIEYEDGTETIVATDERWKSAESPFLRCEVYDGEVFDARKYDPAWCTKDCSDALWESAYSFPSAQSA